MRYLLALLQALLISFSIYSDLVPADAKVEKVADGYKFTEGPALGPDGCIYFTDIPAELILKYNPTTGKTITVVEKSGRANGLAFKEGLLHFCAHGTRMLGVYGTAEGESDIQAALSKEPPLSEAYSLAESYGGKRLNSPNDLAIDKAGNIYFTDPRYGNRDSMEMEIEGIYYFNEADFSKALFEPGDKPYEPVRIDSSIGRPNGIMLSPDEKILYVADNAANWIYAYDIIKPGEVKNKRPFARINGGGGGGSDGMTVDSKGRLYATGHGKVWVFEPTGQLVATIPVGPQTTNVTFGADSKTLYITANKGLYRISLNTDVPLQHAEKE